MNLNHLSYFRVLAKLEHYTQAAEELSITQPSLSHAMSTLEKDLGTYLFEKQGRNIKLTKYGKIYFEYVDRALSELEKGEKKIRELTNVSTGTIELGYIYTLGPRFIPHLIKDFTEIDKNKDIKLIGYDIDGRILKVARSNAEKAGVSKYIEFQRRDFKDFSNSNKYGFIISNPPYGERLGEKKEVEQLYKIFGSFKKKFFNWDYNILTSYEGFEGPFGKKSSKNRKLYNGKIKCYYYQYFDNELIKNDGDMLINHI